MQCLCLLTQGLRVRIPVSNPGVGHNLQFELNGGLPDVIANHKNKRFSENNFERLMTQFILFTQPGL